MKEKVFTLINKGMNRDLSISKVGESCAYENYNIRITATDRDTLLSVTNERGTKKVLLGEGNNSDIGITGTVIGWNVLGNHIILFTNATLYDYIYRIDYIAEPGTGEKQFKMVRGKYPNPSDATQYEFDTYLYRGNLGFTRDMHIDSVVYAESDDVQKIYWVDGKNVLRFLNITASLEEITTWDDTSFDSNKAIDFTLSATIRKEEGGVARPNGVVQYFLTYYNKYGQESGFAWISDLVYLSPLESGGTKDGTNNNKVIITLSSLDYASFTNFKIYSVFRSSLDGETVCYLVADRETASTSVTVVDDGAHLTLEDSDKLLYLGSQAVVAGTLAYKDQTLFLGDITSIGNQVTDTLVDTIRQNMRNNEYGKSTAVTFAYSTDTDVRKDISYPIDSGNYSYESQLQFTSSEILTFKGGEKYRFALKFQRQDGTETDAFWIGDKVNPLYPYIDKYTGKIKRVVAQCVIPSQVMTYINTNASVLGFKTVRLMIAEASYADRLVKAQGIVNPTMFNVWERFNGRAYSVPSWISRMRGGNLASKHFDVVDKCTSSYGEIQCNYWDSEDKKTPFYRQYENGAKEGQYTEEFEGRNSFDLLMVAYTFRYWREFIDVVYWCKADILEVVDANDSTAISNAKTMELPTSFTGTGWSSVDIDGISWTQKEYTDNGHRFKLRHCANSYYGRASMNHGTARSNLYNSVKRYLVQELGLSDMFVVAYSTFRSWCDNVQHTGGTKYYEYHNGNDLQRGAYISFDGALNHDRTTLTTRWFSGADSALGSNEESDPAYYKKHLMFVDENVVTLDSPEIAKSAVILNGTGFKFRIVGAVKMTSVTADYDIDANTGHLSGANIDDFNFSSRFAENNDNEGIIAWPLLREKGLVCTDESIDVRNRTSDNYSMENVTDVVRYWLYMWNHSGNITEYNDTEHPEYNVLNRKVFANMRYGYNTIYLNDIVTLTYADAIISNYDVDNSDITSVPFASEQYNPMRSLDGDGTLKYRYYVGSGKSQLTLPGNMKYPICKSDISPSSIGHIESDDPYLYSKSPVTMEYLSDTHAVVNLKTEISSGIYTHTILPKFFDSDAVNIPVEDTVSTTKITGAIIPWIDAGSKVKNIIFTKIDDDAYMPVFSESSDGLSFVLEFDEYDTVILHWYDAFKEGLSKSDSENAYIRLTTDTTTYYLVNVKDYIYTSDNGNYTITIPKTDVPYSATSSSEANIETVRVISQYVSLSGSVYVTGPEKGKMFALYANTFSNYTIHNNGFVPYGVSQSSFQFVHNHNNADILRDGDRYMLVGEIYQEVTGNEYGGISDSAVKNNRFITAGPAYPISGTSATTIYGNQGDTYFQRYDSMRIRPYGSESENGVVDIVSAMLESHINLDGRTDKYRYSKELASFDPMKFGDINDVYSQQNNFIVHRSNDDTTNAYRSHITWTLEKKDLANVDEWTHITLASSLKLDMDKGPCNALRRLGNSIIAFQDKGISEILYNSRTQLSTQEGVPIEIANSGKVDGKRYITNKFGCTNKVSITEGKNALYFVDSINKTLCSYNGESIDRLSSRLGFDVWFNDGKLSDMKLFFDGRFSDVYLVKKQSDSHPCLVYNELLGVFTSFYDYGSLPVMTNIYDRFISLRDNHIWLQNEGDYCKFFGTQKPFWIQYRVTPDPYGDKIWTNLEYRADFSRVLTDGEKSVISEPTVDTNTGFMYEEDVTFNNIRFWNEYQTTPMSGNCNPIKKFRTWRLAIPRAIPDVNHNTDGLDRIRNPWINILMKKTYTGGSDETNQDIMQLHDVTVHYFE